MLQANRNGARHGASLEDAVTLLSQQIWCWGQDILRPEGNWLLEVGLERTEPPAERSDCPSLYTLSMSGGRRIVLRGFGVFYGDPRHGCVYLPRYKFQPCYTTIATLDQPLWSPDDLPSMNQPDQSTRPICIAMVMDLIDWIWRYEANTVAHLGVDYRRSTLLAWDDGRRPCIPAEDFAAAWHELLLDIDSDASAILAPI